MEAWEFLMAGQHYTSRPSDAAMGNVSSRKITAGWMFLRALAAATRKMEQYRCRVLTARQKQVNVPKTRRTYCKGKDCKKHTQHKVTQYKAGKVRS